MNRKFKKPILGTLVFAYLLISLTHCKSNRADSAVKKITKDKSSIQITTFSDTIKSITLSQFDEIVDNSIELLQTKKLSEISDHDHINIMMALNTIFMRDFKGGHYEQLKVLADKKYVREIIKVYKEWIPNRGMGYYFPKLKMELYGTPQLYAIFDVIK